MAFAFRAPHDPMLLGWLLVLSLVLHQDVCALRTQAVSSPAEFVSAFLNNSTDVIVLTNDVQLTANDWASFSVDQPCLVQRPLLISSQPAFNTLSYNFVQAKCVIEPNITVTYADLLLSNTRYGSGSNIDFYLASPNATIVLRDVARKRLACVASRADPAQLAQVPRAPGLAGQQRVQKRDEYCVRGRCYQGVVNFVDFAVAGVQAVEQPSYAGGYTLWYQNTSLICMSIASNACVLSRGPDQCVIELINKALEGDAATAGGVPLLAMVLPPVLGAPLLILVAAVFWWRRRQRHKRNDEEAAAPKLGGAPAAGAAGANVFVLMSGQTPKSGDGWRMIAQRTAAEFSGDASEKIELGLLIGAGAHGRVYKGRWQGHDVAVKVLQHNSSTAHRVARECDLIMGFSHPFIVRAHQFVTWRQGESQPTPTYSQQHAGQLSQSSHLHYSGSRPSNSTPANLLQDSAAIMHGSPHPSSTAASPSAVQSVAALLRAAQQQRQQQEAAEAEQEEQEEQQRQQWLLQQRRSSGSGTSDGNDTADAAVAVLTGGNAVDDVQPVTGYSDGSASGAQLDAQTWIVTEYCDAGCLTDSAKAGRLTQHGGVPTLEPLLWRLREVADAMVYLHSRNVLHGDLKSANVLCTTAPWRPFGQVAKVSDFGLSLALAEGQTHKSTRALGTVTHMAPEMLRTGRLAPACDVYSFGVLMWELLTQRYAFQGKHYGEIIERVVLHDERPPIPEDAPEDFVLLMSSCWAAKPKLRPTFEAVRQCLDIMLQQRREEQEEAAAAHMVAGLVHTSASGSSALASGGGPMRSHPSFARNGQRASDHSGGQPEEPNDGFF